MVDAVGTFLEGEARLFSLQFSAHGPMADGFVLGGHVVPPARPASPLPPNVPTGPRNQNKYKDRDNNAQAVDGLDYGGGGGFGGMDRGGGTPVVEFDDRSR